MFEFLLLNPGNVADEIHYYKEPSEISVTNPTIYKEDLKHYYQTLKKLDQGDFENVDEAISSDTDSLVKNFNSSINQAVDEINEMPEYNMRKWYWDMEWQQGGEHDGCITTIVVYDNYDKLSLIHI